MLDARTHSLRVSKIISMNFFLMRILTTVTLHLTSIFLGIIVQILFHQHYQNFIISHHLLHSNISTINMRNIITPIKPKHPLFNKEDALSHLQQWIVGQFAPKCCLRASRYSHRDTSCTCMTVLSLPESHGLATMVAH